LQALVDGPQSVTGVHRQVISLKCLSLTDIVVKIPRNATQKKIVAAWKEQDILGKWQKTAWAKKLESKKRRASLTDFDRFKLMIAKKQKSKIIADKLATMKK
jgi:large subunit ribosomal protein L14e